MNAASRFFDGVRAFGAGARFIVLRPKSWPLAAVPVAAALVLTTLTVTLGFYGVGQVSSFVTDGLDTHSALHTVASLALRVVLGAVALVLAVLMGITLAQPVSGPALDAISRAHEVELGGPQRPDGSFWASVWRSLRVSLTALAVGAPIVAVLSLVGMVFPPAVFVTVPLKALVTALLVAWDLLDYPFSLRQMRVRQRIAWMREHLGAVWGFGLVAAVSMMVPLLGLLMLPIGVAGATHLMVKREPQG